MTAKEKIGFTVNEQNAMALLCEVMSCVCHHVAIDSDGDTLDEQATIEDIIKVAECFPSINWGDLYDRFHRQGVNR